MKRKLVAIAISVLLVLLIGCTSFPKPNTDNDTLLIVPTFFLKYVSPIMFGEYHVKIANINVASITLDVPIDPTKLYQVVQGLPEGDYIIPEFYFLYNNSKKGSASPSGVIFAMQKGELTILQKTFQYTQKGDGNTFTYYGGWTDLTKEKVLEVYQSISQEENFASWKLSEKTATLIDHAPKSK